MHREATVRASPSATGAGESREGSEPASPTDFGPTMNEELRSRKATDSSIDDAIDDLEAIHDRLGRDANAACAEDWRPMDDRRDELGDVTRSCGRSRGEAGDDW